MPYSHVFFDLFPIYGSPLFSRISALLGLSMLFSYYNVFVIRNSFFFEETQKANKGTKLSCSIST